MKLIKLDAIDSTNDFLKGLLRQNELENLTVVTAETQTKGKGQMGAVWTTESGKNLIMSILVKNFLFDTNDLFKLNVLFSLAVVHTLESFTIPELSIKWPNDIMSYNLKIGGILIENSIKSDGRIESVVGLGLNINQTNFEQLLQASSLALLKGFEFDRDEVLSRIMETFKKKLMDSNVDFESDVSVYTHKLFKMGVPMVFANNNNEKFMGIIQGISDVGLLKILVEDDSVQEFDIKEVKMFY